MSVESKSNIVSPTKGGVMHDLLESDGVKTKGPESPSEKEDPKTVALKRFNQCVPIKNAQVVDMNDSK